MKLSTLKRTSATLILTAVFLSLAAAAVAAVETKHRYDGVCSRLEGVPGVLQRVGFLASGNC
jgi:hypothetical protein